MDLTQRIATLSPEKRELLIRSLQNKQAATSGSQIRARRRTSDLAPCSFPQQRLWFLQQLEPTSCSYNMPGALRVRGALDVDVLRRALAEISRRHESLRTTFREVDGQPMQVIHPSRELPLTVVDLQHIPAADREQEAVRLAGVEAHTPFDLATGPIIRATLLQLAPDDYVWLWTMHHIISDGWANSVLIREVVTLYTVFLDGKPSPLPELSIQYADYAMWQREFLSGATLDEHLGYWKQQLGTDLPMLNLPTDFPRPPQFSDKGGFRTDIIDPEQVASLKQLCQQERVTLFIVIMAAVQSVLFAATGQDDIVLGTDVANRNRVETEQLIGFCINQLVLRTKLGGNPSFRELMARSWKVALGAYAHQDMPFDMLVKELNPPRAANRTPLFQAKLVLQNTPVEPLVLPNVTIDEILIDNHTSKFDLMFSAQEDASVGMRLGTTYNVDLFKPATIERFVRHLQFTLKTMVGEPDLRLDDYLKRLGEFETQYHQARQASFKNAARQRLQLNRQKDQSRAHHP
ncbi:MAG TPA: condensation domain-containing protein [Kofleriaceae bacterium]|jgi:hypothetical protein|nr:condensation domain-containing protein [Kofleriaceae bacterium]